MKRNPHKLTSISRLAGNRVNGNHVIDHAVIAPRTLEGVFELRFSTLEVGSVGGDNTHHTGRHRAVGEKPALVIRYHVIDVRPLADGLRRADTTRRIERMRRIAERDCLVTGEGARLQPAADIHGHAVRPCRVRAVPLPAVLRQKRVAGDVVGGYFAARLDVSALISPDEYIKMRLGEDAVGDEFQEFKAGELVIGGIQSAERLWCRVDALPLIVHGVWDNRREPRRNHVGIGENLRVSVIWRNHLRPAAAYPRPITTKQLRVGAGEEAPQLVHEFAHYRIIVFH